MESAVSGFMDANNNSASVYRYIFLGFGCMETKYRFKKIETNMFIANNSCEVFLESIELKSLNQIAICLKCKSGFSTQVRVNDMAIFIGDETTTIPIWTKRYDDTFNKIAITENYNWFDVTVLLKPEIKKKMIDHLNDNCKIVIDVNIELVSASYVSTKMQCRGEFIKTNSDNLENDFKLSGKEPMCFWNGNIMYSEKDVVTRL